MTLKSLPKTARNARVLALWLGGWLAGCCTCPAQMAFYNFDFESASNVPPTIPMNFGTYMGVADAFPGWSAYIGTNPAPGITYDQLTTGTANLTLLDHKQPFFGNDVLDGNYSAVLQSGNWPSTGSAPLTPVSIAQTGQIPGGALSLRFTMSPSDISALFVTFNGTGLPVFSLGGTAYGADISAWQGETGELRFGSQPVLFDTGDPRVGFILEGTTLFLDDITFSTQPVPEPGTWLLVSCGTVLLAFWRVLRCG